MPDIIGVRLVQRERKIGDIAFLAGFCELSHFTHAFVRAYKETPGVWRRRCLEQSTES
jgi:AraC-like DNA-binding protein